MHGDRTRLGAVKPEMAIAAAIRLQQLGIAALACACLRLAWQVVKNKTLEIGRLKAAGQQLKAVRTATADPTAGDSLRANKQTSKPPLARLNCVQSRFG